MIELRGTFQAWLQQQKDQVVILDPYSPKPLQCRKIPICYDDDDDEECYTPLRDIIISELPSCIAITPVLSTKETKDSLIIGDEHLDTILEKELDEIIKSSVENLVPDPSKSKDELTTSHFMMRTFRRKSIRTLFLMKKSFSPSLILFEDSDPFMDEINPFLTSDRSIPPGIDSDYSDSEGYNLFPKRLLHDDPGPLPDILDFSNVIQIFPPLLTYPVTSSIILSSRIEDTNFDPSIFDYHLSSFMPGVSHWSGTFMKFNVYPNHLNESPMEILSSTCSPMDP
nr:hypothetical protein [Tanacetum cinerariifolium]